MMLRHSIALGLVSALVLTGCSDKEESASKENAEKPRIEMHGAMPQAHEPSAFAPQGVNPQDAYMGAAHGGGSAKADISMPEQVAADAKAVGSFKVADLFAKREELSGKIVEVKGNVVKVSENIMGRSWVHIQDGSGAEGTNDIIFTTTGAFPQVGSIATAKGKVAAAKDFGYGYFYPVIVEGAVFSK